MSLVRRRDSPICTETCHDKAAQPATTPVISLNDGRLLAKLISGDVIAQELIKLMYHAARLTALCNRGRQTAIEKKRNTR